MTVKIDTTGLVLHLELAVSALRDPALSAGAKRTLGAMLMLADRSTGEVTAAREAIAALAGLTVRSISNEVGALDNAGYITRWQRSLGHGRGSESGYQLCRLPAEKKLRRYAGEV